MVLALLLLVPNALVNARLMSHSSLSVKDGDRRTPLHATCVRANREPQRLAHLLDLALPLPARLFHGCFQPVNVLLRRRRSIRPAPAPAFCPRPVSFAKTFPACDPILSTSVITTLAPQNDAASART